MRNILSVALAILFVAVIGVLSCVYTQSVGEVVVLKNWGGTIAGTSAEPGFHIKAPWQSAIKYDIRNNILSFLGTEEETQFEGGSVNGSMITVNDAGGAEASVEIQVNYSLDPSAAEKLYTNYGTQENFVRSVCAPEIRSVLRSVAGDFDTLSILTAKDEFGIAVTEALQAQWEPHGLIIEQVSIQNTDFDDVIEEKYAESQAAEIAKATAINNQEVAKVEAETKVIQAQGEADANAILAESLTDNVLQQHYIDALISIGVNGNLVVVPEGSDPIVSTTK